MSGPEITLVEDAPVEAARACAAGSRGSRASRRSGAARPSGRLVAVAIAAAAVYPALRRRLHRRQHRLLPRLDLHGDGPVRGLGLWRRAELRADGLLRPRRLRLRRAHHQLRRRLRLHPRRARRSRSALGALFALVLGYFMFYGEIRGVFVGIVTLSVTLVFETFMAQTAGPAVADRRRARLNGFNGMSGHPAADHPLAGGDIMLFAGTGLYYVLLGAADRSATSGCASC